MFLLNRVSFRTKAAPRPCEDEPLAALGIRCREESTDVCGSRDTEEARARAPDGIEDGSDVVHAGLERHAARPVGKPRPPSIEDDHAYLGRQPLEKGPTVRRDPQRLQVGQEWRDDERARAIADDLIGDRNPTGARVVNVWDVHRVSVPFQTPVALRALHECVLT